MSRKQRIWYPGAIYHIMSRGNRKNDIFRDDTDHRFFLERLKTITEQHSCKLHAVCLMTNHFHLEMETTNVPPGRIMSGVLGEYASFYNWRHSFTGHVFEGRYKASIIEDASYFLEVSRYIHLNPVKAMMTKDPLKYPYSSYNVYLSGNKRTENSRTGKILEEMVETSRVMSAFDNSKEKYRWFVEGDDSHSEHEERIMADMNEDEMWIPKIRS
jgi:REP element-mobilizing transposase RayT